MRAFIAGSLNALAAGCIFRSLVYQNRGPAGKNESTKRLCIRSIFRGCNRKKYTQNKRFKQSGMRVHRGIAS